MWWMVLLALAACSKSDPRAEHADYCRSYRNALTIALDNPDEDVHPPVLTADHWTTINDTKIAYRDEVTKRVAAAPQSDYYRDQARLGVHKIWEAFQTKGKARMLAEVDC